MSAPGEMDGVGPFAEIKGLVAGWMVIDVESRERAHQVAVHLSTAPGARGEPIQEWIEVRAFLENALADAEQ